MADEIAQAPETPSSTNVSPIVFYCKDCRKLIIGPMKVGGKYVYKCSECGTKNVAFGTLKSIQNFYHLDPNAPRTVPVES